MTTNTNSELLKLDRMLTKAQITHFVRNTGNSKEILVFFYDDALLRGTVYMSLVANGENLVDMAGLRTIYDDKTEDFEEDTEDNAAGITAERTLAAICVTLSMWKIFDI